MSIGKEVGFFVCFKGQVVVWNRLRKGHPRYKEGGSRQPKEQGFFKVCHDPKVALGQDQSKIMSFISPADKESEAQARTVCGHRRLAGDKRQCNLLGTATRFILSALRHQPRHRQPWTAKGGDASKRS